MMIINNILKISKYFLLICLFIYNIDVILIIMASIFGKIGELYVKRFWFRWHLFMFIYILWFQGIKTSIKNKFKSLKIYVYTKIKKLYNIIVGK